MLTVSNFTCFDNEVANLVFLFFDFRAHFLNIFFCFSYSRFIGFFIYRNNFEFFCLFYIFRKIRKKTIILYTLGKWNFAEVGNLLSR